MALVGIYKPPNFLIRPLADYIDNLFTEYSRRKIIFTGYFNIDLLNEDAGSELCYVMFKYNVFPLINRYILPPELRIIQQHAWIMYGTMDLRHFPVHSLPTFLTTIQYLLY